MEAHMMYLLSIVARWMLDCCSLNLWRVHRWNQKIQMVQEPMAALSENNYTYKHNAVQLKSIISFVSSPANMLCPSFWHSCWHQWLTQHAPMSVASKHLFFSWGDRQWCGSLVHLLQDMTTWVACLSLKNDAYLSERSSLTVNDNMDLLLLCLDVTFEKRPLIDSANVTCLSFKEAIVIYVHSSQILHADQHQS